MGVSRTRPLFEDAFDELFELAFKLAVRVVGTPAVAEDVAAETMVRTLLHWKRVGDRPWRTAWVVRVATNVALDAYRRSWRPSVDSGQGLVTADDTVVLREALVAALRQLPLRQRQAIAMRYLADQSDKDIAGAMGVRPVTVRTHLRRGLAALRVSLGPTWEERLHA